VCFVTETDLLIIFNTHTHTHQYWHCSLLNPLNTTPPLSKSSPLPFNYSLTRKTPPTPSPLAIGRTTKWFYFRWLTNLKKLRNTLKFPWKGNAHNKTESR